MPHSTSYQYVILRSIEYCRIKFAQILMKRVDFLGSWKSNGG